MNSIDLPLALSDGSPLYLELARQQFIEGLPYQMMSLLERRYLTSIEEQNWEIGGNHVGPHRPLLRQIIQLGKPKTGSESMKAMPHLLTACHQPGHALVMAVHGDGCRHRIYVGGRRTDGAAAPATPDFLQNLESSLRSYFSGLKFGSQATSMDTQAMPDLCRLLQTAPNFGVITGIPSVRGGTSGLDLQTIDHLVESVGNHRYVMMIVGEPLEPKIIDRTLDACRRLKSEVHGFVQMTISRNKEESHSKSRTELPAESQLMANLPAGLFALATFLQLVGARCAPAITSMGFAVSNWSAKSQSREARQISESQSTGDSATAQLLNANAEACESLLDQHIKRIIFGRSNGWWQMAVYVAAETKAGLHAVAAAVRSIGSGDASSLDPLRLISFPPHLVRETVEHGQILSLRPFPSKQAHPLGPVFDAAATCVNSDELAILVNLPRQEIPGLPMREHAEFGLCVPPRDGVGIEIGTLLDGMGRPLEPVTVPLNALNRHVFITGMTGYGKTTTCKRILLEAYERHGLPFLVVEPAKSEYRELANMPTLRGKLRVYAMGGDSPLPFRLNPLQPVPNLPLARHIDLLKAVFNASFPMFAGMTYILEEALHEVYRDRGWSLYTSRNSLLGPNPSPDDLAALTPTLEDLHAKIDVVLGEKKYGKEVEQNLGAALRSRLKSLMVGNKGIMLNTRRSTPLENIFRGPAVIELQNLGDDEEKSFVMALLFVLLYEYAEVRQRDIPAHTRGGLQHLTLIEEAHRLLQADGGRPSTESADPRGKAVAMFTDMLAEMRAYGEGFIIADQSPTKLVNATLKNSALKIVHRLTYPDDRQAVGACINLDQSQTQFLNDLPVGLAVVHDERIGLAVMTRIHPLAIESDSIGMGSRAVEAVAGLDQKDRRQLHRHGGCHACPSPCEYFHRLEEFKSTEVQSRNQRRFFDNLLIGEPEKAWDDWQAWCSQHPVERGLAYCIRAQAAFDWICKILSARNILFGPGQNHFSPQDQLHRDIAARAVARLMSAWDGNQCLEGPARAAFFKTQQELRKLVASAPPSELAGCAKCPARCQMLPFASASVRSLEKALSSKLLGERSMTPAQHLDSIQNWLRRDASLDLGIRDHESHFRKWTYCLMANSSLLPQAATRRDQLLLELLQPPAQATDVVSRVS